MKKLIAIALLIGSLLTAFYGFAVSVPMMGSKSMTRINDITGNMRIELEVPLQQVDTGTRCVPFYMVSVLAGAGGILVLSGLREKEDDEDEEDFFFEDFRTSGSLRLFLKDIWLFKQLLIRLNLRSFKKAFLQRVVF